MPRRSANADNTVGRSGPSKMTRTAMTVNHFLHWVSALIVMSIAAYFIRNFHHNTHLIYWVTIGALSTLLWLIKMLLPLVKSYKGYSGPLDWIFSYLWLTAFIFAAQDYNSGRCWNRSPGSWDWSRPVGRCGLKRTLEAFAFLAFFTNLVGTYLEYKLWDNQRFKSHHGYAGDKLAARPSGDTATTATGAPVTTV